MGDKRRLAKRKEADAHWKMHIGKIDLAPENGKLEAMRPTGESNSFVLPPALLAEVEAAADAEHRSAADVVRELVEQGLNERRWKTHSEQELRRARELGLPDADDQPMSDEYRQTLREKIAQGMESARQGKLVDGDAVFARIKAEMAAIEWQGGG